MNDLPLYQLPAPTRWATPPEKYSFSSLQSIHSCPRRWQMLRSEWGSYTSFPVKPNRSAVSGQIVHDGLKKLSIALAQRGQPSIGSSAFQDALEEVDFWNFFSQELEKKNEELAGNSKVGRPLFLQVTPRELANKAIRLFREQYSPKNSAQTSQPQGERETPSRKKKADPLAILRARGSLSEYRFEHPELPFQGLLDLVQELENGVIKIVDFKTGQPKEEHQKQLRYYAVLWWRCTGALPSILSIQYLNHSVERTITESDLVRFEQELKDEIIETSKLLSKQPTDARPGSTCQFCPVRARCSEGWSQVQLSTASKQSGSIDLEVTVASAPTNYGFSAQKQGGKEVSVVYERSISNTLPPLDKGDQVRILSATLRENGKAVEVRHFSEFFHV